jgi:hypothetical protein
VTWYCIQEPCILVGGNNRLLGPRRGLVPQRRDCHCGAFHRISGTPFSYAYFWDLIISCHFPRTDHRNDYITGPNAHLSARPILSPPTPLPQQADQLAYHLSKARTLCDAGCLLGHASLRGRTRQQTRSRRIGEATLCLKARLERGDPLPSVRAVTVGGLGVGAKRPRGGEGGGGEDGERRRDVLDYVVQDMPHVLFIELVGLLRP